MFLSNKVTLEANQTTKGGGVFYLHESDSVFESNVFINNTLINGNGGTLTADCDSLSQLSCVNYLQDNLFEGNQASGRGGAVVTSLYGPVSLNNLMVHNRALRGGNNLGSYPYMLGFLTKDKRVLTTL